MKAGINIVNMAIFGCPSARKTLLLIIAQAKNGTPGNKDLKYSFAGINKSPFPPHIPMISSIKKVLMITTVIDKPSVIMDWLPKVIKALSSFFAPRARLIIEAPPTPIDMPKAEIKKLMGNTTAIAPNPMLPMNLPT